MANETLPIAAYRGIITEAVRENDIVAIAAPTGAGKSTQVGQYLLDKGYLVIITETRRLAARTLSARTAEEYGEKLGGIIGFRTAFEREDSVRTKCLYCTDGLALVRELMGHGERDVLILDEVHEWNINIEVLLAWAKRELARGAKFKLVIMSATLDAERLMAYLGPSAKLVNVPGRLFPVLERTPGRDEVASAIELLQNNRNVLIFMPGKSEIAKTIRELKESGVSAEILPLHGEMLPEEQARCFQHYGRPKCVVATNVAQTSVTIDDIDAVVDSGLERRTELVMGVEGLYIRPISLADSTQRKGRAGRCKPGVYLDHCPAADRPQFAVAEILRSRLDQTVLRLARAGIDAEELEFFHQPNRAEIHEAKRALRVLGCMDAEGRVTDIGNRVAELPISVQYGRMVVEAERLGVVADIVSIAALLEVGDIILRKDKDGNPTAHLWRRLVPDEHESDALAQLVLYRKAHTMSPAEMPQNGIHPKAYKKVLELRRHLADSLRSKVKNFDSSGNRRDIIRAMCAGFLDHVYRCDGRYCHDGSGLPRQLARESVLSGTSGCVIGVPWDLEVPSKWGGTMVLNLVHIATKVDPKWLQELAPEAMTCRRGLDAYYSEIEGCVVSRTEVLFNGMVVSTKLAPDPGHPDAARLRLAEERRMSEISFGYGFGFSPRRRQSSYWPSSHPVLDEGVKIGTRLSGLAGFKASEPAVPPPVTIPTPRPVIAPAFTDIGDRHFRCRCAAAARLTKSEYQKFRRGELVSLTCAVCGASSTLNS